MSPRKAPKRETMGLYAFRLPDALIARVDIFAKLLQAERPGVAVTRADAVRALLNLGLEAATPESPPGGAPGPKRER